MMESFNNTLMPNLTEATRDLKETERQFETDEAKCKGLREAISKLQLEKQIYLAAISECEKATVYLQNCLTKTLAELENVAVSINKAKVMECGVSDRIKHAKELFMKKGINVITSDMKLEPKPKDNKEYLEKQTQEFQNAIANNNKEMEEILKSSNAVGNSTFHNL